MATAKFNASTTARPRVWDIWLADVDFESGSGHKKRPVLVLSAKGASFTVLEITSRTTQHFTDITIHDLDGTGLEKQSTVRTGKKRVVPRDKLVHPIGRLPSEYHKTVASALELHDSMTSDD